MNLRVGEIVCFGGNKNSYLEGLIGNQSKGDRIGGRKSLY